jgi:N-acetylglucosamine-6-phosphate deacetylase
VVGAALASPAVHVEVIADGVHVHPGALAAAFRAKGGERMLVVTDAVEPAGERDGIHVVNGRQLLVDQGSIRLADGTLAGSALTMNRAVAVMVRQAGVPLQTAVQMATLNPARRLGLQDRKGSLEAGKHADLVVVDADFGVWLTVVRGMVAFDRTQ